MSSAECKSSKPASASELFANLKAAKEIYCDLTYQIKCLNELYDILIPQNGNRRASSSSRAQDGPQRDPKVLQQLFELKANLRKDYGNPRLLPPLERLTVVKMFDDQKQPFFDFRIRPLSGYPTGYPFFIDDNDKGTIVGISEAIYQEVLKAVQEEEKEEKKEEENNNKTPPSPQKMSSAGCKSSKPLSASELFANLKAAKEIYCDLTYQIKCLNELYDILIPQNGNRRGGNSSSQRNSKALQQLRELKANLRKNYGNPRLLPPLERLTVVMMFDDQKQPFFDFRIRPLSGYPTGYPFFIDDNDKGTIVGISEAIYQEVLKAVQEEEKEEKEEENNNNSLNHNNNSHAAEDSLPPTDLPNRASRTGDDEAAAAQRNRVVHSTAATITTTSQRAASVVVPPAAGTAPVAANVRVLQLQVTPFPHHHNNSTTPSAQRRQQPPAAAAVAEERGTLKKKPTENSSIYHVLGSNNNKRPADHSNAAQPQGSLKRIKVFATPGTSTQAASATSQAAIAEHFLASADFRKAAEGQKFDCPLCKGRYVKAAMKDHLDMAHISLGHYVPYQCTYPGCTYTNDWGVKARAHARQEHGCLNSEKFIVKAAAAVVVPKTSGFSRASSSSSSSAAAANRATTTTASTTTTSTPSVASTSQQQQHQRLSSTSASTSTSTAQTLSVEEYLRAHCPDYVAAKNGSTKVMCPNCPKIQAKRQLKDHIFAEHRGLKPYQCQLEGCGFASSWQTSAAQHVKKKHNGGSYAQYIVYREE